MATALILPFGVVAAHGAGAAEGTSCADTSGVATFAPPLPVLGAGTTVKPTVTVKKAKTKSCTGGGVKGGVIASVTKFHDPTSCDILLDGAPGPHPPTGTFTIKWNTGTTSVANVTLEPVEGSPAQADIVGTVKSGPFKHMSLDLPVSFVPKKGDCFNDALAAVTFTGDSALTIG